MLLLLFMRYNTLTVFFLVIAILPHVLFFAKFTICSSLLDLWSRTALNTYYLNIFHFFWTNLWYLYLFFLYITFLYYFFRIKHIAPIICYIAILFFIFNYCIYMEIIFNNVFSSFLLMNSELLNTLLKNSVNKIHPFLLYSSTATFFLLLGTRGVQKCNTFHLTSVIPQQSTTFFKKTVVSMLVALYLGSWWALQEGSWGGWWNWDASEFLGLLVLYLLLTLFHVRKNLTSVYNLYSILIQSLTYTFVYFFMLQLNFTTISHNFGFRTLKFLNTELLLLILFTLFFFYYIYILQSKARLYAFFIKIPKYILNNFIVAYYTIILFNIIIVLSLISFFAKILVNFKFFFSFINFSKLLFCLFFLFYQHLMSMSLCTMFLLFLVPLQLYSLFLFFKHSYNSSKNFTTHYFILWLFFLSILYRYSVLNDHIHINYNIVHNNLSYLSTNSREIELFLNFITTSTSFEGKSFELLIHKNYIYQIYLINATNWNLVVTTIDQLPTLLNTLLTFSLTTLTIFWLYRYKF